MSPELKQTFKEYLEKNLDDCIRDQDFTGIHLIADRLDRLNRE